MKYTFVIEKAADGSFSAFVPDLPGCTSSGDTLEELQANIREAVDLYIESLRENNEPIPQPGSMTGTVEAA